MSRTRSDRDVAAPSEADRGLVQQRASTLIADPANIGWPLALVFTVAAAIDQTIGLGGRWNEGASLWNVVGVFVGLAVTLLLLALAKCSYLGRRFARRRAWVTVVTMFIAVLVGTAVGGIVTSALAGPEHIGPSPIGLDRMLFGTALLVIGAWGVGLLRAYRSGTAELQGVQHRLTVATTQSQQALRAERELVIAPLATTLRELVDSLASLTPSDAAHSIREVAEEIVRPVSHRLSATTTPMDLPAETPPPRPTWRVTLAQVANEPLLLPLVMAVTMVLFISRLTVNEAAGTPSIPRSPEVAVTVDWTSLLRALAQLAVVFFTVWLAASVAERLLRRVLPSRSVAERWIIVLISVPVVAVTAQLVVLAVFGIPDLSPKTQYVLTNPLVFIGPLVIIATVAGLLRAVRTRLSDIVVDLHERNTELAFTLARLNEELWMQRRTLSKNLHGTIQGTLNSAALLMAHVARDDDGAEKRADVVQRITTAIGALESGTPDHMDIGRELAQIEQTWRGVCDIGMHLEQHILERIQADPLCSASFVDILGEAIANAVIRGGAAHVTITVAEQGAREVRIDAVDDGTGPGERTSGGLGSQLLREACTDWGLTSDGTATRLFAVIPLQSSDQSSHTSIGGR